MIQFNIQREKKNVTASKYPFVVDPKLSLNHNTFIYLYIILLVSNWHRTKSEPEAQFPLWSKARIWT